MPRDVTGLTATGTHHNESDTSTEVSVHYVAQRESERSSDTNTTTLGRCRRSTRLDVPRQPVRSARSTCVPSLSPACRRENETGSGYACQKVAGCLHAFALDEGNTFSNCFRDFVLVFAEHVDDLHRSARPIQLHLALVFDSISSIHSSSCPRRCVLPPRTPISLYTLLSLFFALSQAVRLLSGSVLMRRI